MEPIKFASNTADLRGMRVDEGLGVLDNALNRLANKGAQVCPPPLSLFRVLSRG